MAEVVSRTGNRQAERRDQIMACARELLRERGWHGTAIDDIGKACGLTGPAVYRYFANKQDLLTCVMTYASDLLWNSVPKQGEPRLDSYVESHVQFVLDNADLVQLWYREALHLPAEAFRAQRRSQLRYVEKWVDALRAERPDLDTEDARTMVRAAIGLIHSVAHSSTSLSRRHIHRILVRMTLAALCS